MAIEYCIKNVLDPAIDHFNHIWAKLLGGHMAPRGSLLGESRMPGSTAFNNHCEDLLRQLELQQRTVTDNQETLARSLQEFRDILQQTVDRYRTTELRNDEMLRAIQPPQ